jgi:hypothetical protein
MATDAISESGPAVAESHDRATDAAPAGARPFPRSWVNVLIDAIARSPIPSWLIYAAATSVTVVVSNSQGWIAGTVPVGSLTAVQTFWGVFLVASFWLLHFLDTAAGRAFDAFRPLLDDSPDEVGRLRYQLVVIPALPAVALTVLAVPFTLAYYLSDPAGSQIVGLPPAALVVRTLAESLSSALIFILVYHTYRQLRWVGRIHDRARRIDLYRPGPTYAFSRLTAPTGASLVFLMWVGYAANPQPLDLSSAVTLTLWLPGLVAIPALGVFAFVAPLWGMHRRLAAEKERLRDASEARLEGLLAEVERDVDALDLSRADGLNKTLGSLLQQREVIARLSTWPWSTTTARGFGTAIMLPVVLFLIQRLLSLYL